MKKEKERRRTREREKIERHRERKRRRGDERDGEQEFPLGKSRFLNRKNTFCYLQ